MRIARSIISSVIISGSAAITVGIAAPAGAAVGSISGCCQSHRARLSSQNINPHRQQSRISVINRLQVNNISRSDSNPRQRIDDDRFGISSSAAAAGGGGGGGGGGGDDAQPADAQ